MTKVYCIAYDLLQAGQDYDGIRAAVETYDCCQIQQSVWLVRSAESSRTIYYRLARHVDSNDKLLVAEITPNCCGLLSEDQAAWVKQRLT